MSPEQDREAERVRESYERILDMRFERHREAGTNMESGQLDFLRESAERDWLRTQDTRAPKRRPRPMSNAQRKTKAAVKRKLRGGLSDLAALDFVTGAGVKSPRPWFTAEDVREIVDKDLLARVVAYVVSNKSHAPFDEKGASEYANAILEALSGFYAAQGERVVVQREIRGW